MLWPLSKSNRFWQHENKLNHERCPWNNSRNYQSSNIHRNATQSWSKLRSLLKDNCDAESVFFAQQDGQYGLMPWPAPAYWQLECESAKKVAFCSWMSSYGCHDHQNIEDHDSRWYISTVLKDVTTLTEHNLLNAPVLPRRRRLPARYLMKHRFQIHTRLGPYFEALDKLTISIADCSDQHDYNIYMNCEGLLLKTAIGKVATS